MIEIKVPTVGESISEVTLVEWLKKDGEWVERDEVLCELESEKATFELSAEQAGILHTVAKNDQTLNIGDVACKIDETAKRPEGTSAPAVPDLGEPKEEPKKETKKQEQAAPAKSEAKSDAKATPVAKTMMADKKLSANQVKGSGEGGRILKKDVLAALENPGRIGGGEASRSEDRKKMSNLRKTVSRRLVEAKNSTAMLTTFNEVDMTNIMAIRNKYKDSFKEQHGVNLGFMSFFTKACCWALTEWPSVNAYIDGEEIVYHDYCDISIAVSAPKGLVVPVIRNAESMGMAEIEQAVRELATKARDNKLTIEEMTGGTFTITNGGVFGSLMSTPIINIPQSAILGMHKIQDRPMAIDGKVEIRPMMYLALSYDHRIIDGRESVGFLVRVKELLENPELMLMGKDPVKTLLEV
ncbi:MAG: 2-oxoglutarate dehydrogenase complex dihydrolipoyllysine-residue succinyltransferase [Chitinophagaceae bacterium]|nr:2-oxoglutarate dehydrogenase complex dihydrolipoyllysine-residue succinyltransferase [Chitinophagaceae bacterium]MCB9045459.1 2-oxoglutarate dehydrogenase complex dihydrolipoyllysine-residue succinyltransferase [Chitinophagales bacterium]